MELSQAEIIARQVVDHLAPFCQRVAVVGSIRRRKPFPRDIDILLIPGNQGRLLVALQGLGTLKYGGQKAMQCSYQGEQVDVYFATPETWATLLLIRTGSAAHNVRLATRAKRRGWRLHADGRGLFDQIGRRLAGETEEAFFEALELPYAEPWERR